MNSEQTVNAADILEAAEDQGITVERLTANITAGQDDEDALDPRVALSAMRALLTILELAENA